MIQQGELSGQKFVSVLSSVSFREILQESLYSEPLVASECLYFVTGFPFLYQQLTQLPTTFIH